MDDFNNYAKNKRKIAEMIRKLAVKHSISQIYTDSIVVAVFLKRTDLDPKDSFVKELIIDSERIKAIYTEEALSVINEIAELIIGTIDINGSGDVLGDLYMMLF